MIVVFIDFVDMFLFGVESCLYCGQSCFLFTLFFILCQFVFNSTFILLLRDQNFGLSNSFNGGNILCLFVHFEFLNFRISLENGIKKKDMGEAEQEKKLNTFENNRFQAGLKNRISEIHKI